MTDEECYAAVTDELNDVQRPEDLPPGYGPITLEDLDPQAVRGARRYAEFAELPWPPQVGDFDSYYERKITLERAVDNDRGRV